MKATPPHNHANFGIVDFCSEFTMSFLRYKELIEDGDTVIVYLSVLHYYALKITAGEVFQTKYGALKHSEVIGRKYGDVVNCSHGWVYVLFPTPELWTLSLPHRTQILYTPDISLVTLQLDLKPGCVVCEAGTGSGSLSHAIARTIAPDGHLYTFDFHEQRAQVAKEEFASHGLEKVVTVKQRDVCQNGFGLTGVADAVFLDLPHPWEAVPGSVEALKTRGRLCSFSPCVEQVQRMVEAIGNHGFGEIATVECVLRPYEVKQVTVPEYCMENVEMQNIPESNSHERDRDGSTKMKARAGKLENNGDPKSSSVWIAHPPFQAAGHTGYLTFASLTK